MKELKDYSLPTPNEWVRDDGEVVTTHQKVPFGEHKPKYTVDQLKQMIGCTGLQVEHKRLDSGGWDVTVLDGNGEECSHDADANLITALEYNLMGLLEFGIITEKQIKAKLGESFYKAHKQGSLFD